MATRTRISRFAGAIHRQRKGRLAASRCHLVLLESPSDRDGEDIVSACDYGTSGGCRRSRKSLDHYT
ncbi:MAG: hypothetical protein ACI80N_003611, partial [Gammaproteobacteria bacterium]